MSKVIYEGDANLRRRVLYNIIFIFDGDNSVSSLAFEDSSMKKGGVSISILDPLHLRPLHVIVSQLS